MESEIKPSFYSSAHYLSFRQISSHAWQTKLVLDCGARTVLEVGVGSGLTTAMLRSYGVGVTTADINGSLEPDVVVSVLHLADALSAQRFDAVLCCEVLEHLPFSQFDAAVSSLASVTDTLILTLPSNRPWFGVGGLIKIPGREYWFPLGVHLPTQRRHVDDNHYWELWSERDTAVRSVEAKLRVRFSSVTSKILPTNPHHVAFICQK